VKKGPAADAMGRIAAWRLLVQPWDQAEDYDYFVSFYK
jgi:hypothetical protein